MTPQELMQFLATRRTYRRFTPQPVPGAALADLLEAARIASCGANRQTLKYLAVRSPQMVEKTNALVHWAAYLPPEQGTPKPEERPTLFVAVCRDTALPGGTDVDLGLALGSMTAAAWAHGVGSCIMGSIDRPALAELYALPPVAAAVQPGGFRLSRPPEPYRSHAKRRRALLFGRRPRLLRPQAPAVRGLPGRALTRPFPRRALSNAAPAHPQNSNRPIPAGPMQAPGRDGAVFFIV